MQQHEMFRNSQGHWFANDLILNNCLEKGYIKEVEEKEFTRSDAVDLLKYFEESGDNQLYYEVINNWLKQRDK